MTHYTTPFFQYLFEYLNVQGYYLSSNKMATNLGKNRYLLLKPGSPNHLNIDCLNPETSGIGGAAAGHWRVDHLICDATGVGEGLASWLAARLGAAHVAPFKFSASSKAALGAFFLALIAEADRLIQQER
jgi:hypothetical protein